MTLPVFNCKYYSGQETQVWLDYALGCNYLKQENYDELYDQYENIIAMLINMNTKPE